jgi:hypothetical protein
LLAEILGLVAAEMGSAQYVQAQVAVEITEAQVDVMPFAG